VLVLDTDRVRAGVIMDLLRSIGRSDIHSERDLGPFWKQITGRNPDLIFVAGKMNPIDGLEFIRSFRRSDDVPSNAATVVLSFNGADLNDITNAMNAGADAVLSFPVSQARFSALLSALQTQKRPFVRSLTYVGPCRRRGMVGSTVLGRRLEDVGGAEALTLAVEALESLFQEAHGGSVTQSMFDAGAEALADFFASVGDGKGDPARLRAQSLLIVRQFADDALRHDNFDQAYAPLRRIMSAAFTAKDPIKKAV
jgi:CheY-like chemotaxis protein